MRIQAIPIRVIYVVDTLGGGGAERIVVDMATHLDQSRFAPLICTTRELGLYVSEVQSAGVPVHCLCRKNRFDIMGFLELVRLLKREDIDIVHCHKAGSNTLGRLAAFVARVPIILAHEHTMPQRSFIQRLVDRVLARISTSVITCDLALKKALVSTEGLDADKVVVVHNGVNLSKFASRKQESGLRDRLGLDNGPVVGTFARLDFQKDISTLLAAIPYVLTVMPNCNFVIVGEGPLRGQLEMEVSELGIAEHVHFLGYRSEIPELLQLLNVFVLSSQWEGLPVTILEAMASGKPIVSTNVGGVSEVVLDRETGILVPPQSPRALGEAIISLLVNPNLAESMGFAGQERARREFSIEAMMCSIEAIYLAAFSAYQRRNSDEG